ncbi:MAG: 2-C-methyl-D-erythritol 4-phosphate cytidylyltransferase [Gammaproteobacteria bacterium]
MTMWAVIPAAGRGERFGADRPKQYLTLAGRPMLEHSLAPFLASPAIAGVVIALAANDGEWPKIAPERPPKPLVTAIGGASRAESVAAALAAIADRVVGDDWVLVHDAARPCLSGSDLERLIGTLRDDRVGGILAAPLADTLKRADDAGCIAATVERACLWRAQTPQMFRYGLLRNALDGAAVAGLEATDEAMAMEHAGFAPRIVAARENNLKVTRPEDLSLAEAVLASRKMVESSA